MTTEAKTAQQPTKLIGAWLPTPQAAALKDLAWQRRTTVSDLVRQATAALLAQQEGRAS